MDIIKTAFALGAVRSGARTHGACFRLHGGFTVALLAATSCIVTTKQYFGDPIACDTSDAGGVRKDVAEAFCWMTGTYTVESMDSQTPGLGNDAGRPKDWHLYYQWVAVVLLLQACFFYAPLYLWNVWEGGRMTLLVKDVSGPFVPSGWHDTIRPKLVNYVMSFKHYHTIYAYRYILCEALNLTNVLLQMFFINWLLNGKFISYGFRFVDNQESLSEVFPRTTKCKYHRYGPTGTVENHDFLCVLALNILNEKLFLIIWFWFVFLIVVSVISVVYRLLIVFSLKLRAYLLMTQTRCSNVEEMEDIVDGINYGSFFVLYLIGRNTNPMVYNDILDSVHTTVIREKPMRKANKIIVV